MFALAHATESFFRSKVGIGVITAAHVYAIVTAIGAADVSPIPFGWPRLVLSPIYQFLIVSVAWISILVVVRANQVVLLGLLIGTAMLTLVGVFIPFFQNLFLELAVSNMSRPYVAAISLLVVDLFLLCTVARSHKVAGGALMLGAVTIAALTFAPRDWMLIELPWAYGYAVVDALVSNAKDHDTFRKVIGGGDVAAELSGASCQTEIYHTLGNNSLAELNRKIATELKFGASSSAQIVRKVRPLLRDYALVYACY